MSPSAKYSRINSQLAIFTVTGSIAYDLPKILVAFAQRCVYNKFVAYAQRCLIRCVYNKSVAFYTRLCI